MVPDETMNNPNPGFEKTTMPLLALMPIGDDYSLNNRPASSGRQDEDLSPDLLSIFLFDDDDSDEDDMDEDDSFDDMDDDFDDDFDDDEDFDEEEDYEDEEEDYDYEEDVDYDDFDE